MELKKLISTVVFWGAAWGIFEATLGNLLHVMNLTFGWLIWFPIAFYFMNKVYKQTGKYESILFISALAAAIKLIDLLMPIRVDKVINPAVSILLEGLVVFIALRVAERFKGLFRYRILQITAISISWRILYLVYVLFLPAWMVAISPVRGLIPFLRFHLLESSVNALIIYSILKLFEKISILNNSKEDYLKRQMVKEKILGHLKEISSMPVSAFSLLIVAIFVQWIS